MEFIQKKTADQAVEHFLLKAAEEGISLAWDRFETQLPECGFCEAGLSCRDCLQGPCISHPFRDSNKAGVCGKDKDLLAAQSLLRLAVKGSMAILDQVHDFVEGVEVLIVIDHGQEASLLHPIYLVDGQQRGPVTSLHRDDHLPILLEHREGCLHEEKENI